MPKTTTALSTPLRPQLDRLAAFDPGDAPVLSLYLDTRRDQQGRPQHEAFLRKTSAERAGTLSSDARQSFDRDITRIQAYLAEQLQPSTNGVAIFACARAGNFFEAIQLAAPLEPSCLFVGPTPHLYPLARVNDQFPRYAALMVDTNSARLFVFALGALETSRAVTNQKTRHTALGGMSQPRYQRHIENFHLHHMKEVVDVLDRVVRQEQIAQIVASCDDVARPLLMAQLPRHLAEKVVDVVKLEAHSSQDVVLRETFEALRAHDADDDVSRVQAMHDAWHSGGLGVVGPDATLRALSLGEVEELLIAAAPDRLTRAAADADQDLAELADTLVRRAQQQSARIRFIEDSSLLDDVGGVGALLRFTVDAPAPTRDQSGREGSGT